MIEMISRDVLPAFNKVVADAETMLRALTGRKVNVHVTLDSEKWTDETNLRLLVTDAYDVTWAQMISNKRSKQDVVEARHVYCYILRTRFKHSYQSIGARLNRDHTTVIYAVNKVKDLIDCKDSYLVDTLYRILNSLSDDTQTV